MIAKIEQLSKPVIAAVNGHAVGGGLEISLACDIRIASKTAKLGLTEAKVGAIAGGGGTQRLPRLIGAGLALEMLFTGAPVSGERAEQIGLVNYAVDAPDVLQTAIDLASRIAQNAPLSLNAYKQLVHKGTEMDIEQALDLEMSYANEIARSEDRAEGMKAFLEKRKPEFKGQ
jgi:enoyl-CoA hydratase